jgi:hypothetical protein
MRIGKSKGILFALGIGVLTWPSMAGAVTFVQTSDDCSATAPCGITANNRIDVTADGSLTRISVSLANNWNFVNTGAQGTGGALTFGLTSAQTLIFTTVAGGTPAQWTATAGGFQVLNGVGVLPTSSETASSALADASGKFSFTNGFAILCNSNGNSPGCGGTLTFDVNLTLANFLALLATSNGSPFFADVINSVPGNPNFGNTGIIDFTLQTSAVPLPPAALLFGTALVGLGILGRRRKNGLAQA